MSVEIRGRSDSAVVQVAQALGEYQKTHPMAEIVVSRQNSVSIRSRIIDPDFSNIDRAERHDLLWNYFKVLDEDVQDQITLLLLLTPEEQGKSLANFEFENPIPSRL